MTDLTNLDDVAGKDLSEEQIRGILATIDLDVTNLLRDGKLAALRYAGGEPGGRSADRAANLQALLAARKHYEHLLAHFPSCSLTRGVAP